MVSRLAGIGRLWRSRLTHLHEQGWGRMSHPRVSGHASLAQLQKYLGVDQAAVDEKLLAVDVGGGCRLTI